MKAFALLFALALPSFEAYSAPPSGPYAVRPAESNVSFIVKKWGVLDVNGRFGEVSGSLHFEPGRPETARVVLRVAVASVVTGASGRDEALRSADFFDAGRYPEMTFVSAKVTPTGKDAALVSGDLTIRGVTKRIEVPVKLLGVASEGDRELAGFETDFTIDRREFGVLGARWSGGRALISNEVRVHLAIGAARGRT